MASSFGRAPWRHDRLFTLHKATMQRAPTSRKSGRNAPVPPELFLKAVARVSGWKDNKIVRSL